MTVPRVLLLVAVLSVLAFVPIPFGQGIIVSDVRVGIVFILAISAIAPVGEIIAGWASNNKYSTYGAVRAASLDVSYEVPMILAAASVILLAGSMSTQDIISKQQPLWYVFLQPVGAFIFFATALAKAGVIPTDLGESESELIAGYFTECIIRCPQINRDKIERQALFKRDQGCMQVFSSTT